MTDNGPKYTTDMVLGEPDELLGYLTLGQQGFMERSDDYAMDDETHSLWSEGLGNGLATNTHGCWGFFPVVS